MFSAAVYLLVLPQFIRVEMPLARLLKGPATARRRGRRRDGGRRGRPVLLSVKVGSDCLDGEVLPSRCPLSSFHSLQNLSSFWCFASVHGFTVPPSKPASLPCCTRVSASVSPGFYKAAAGQPTGLRCCSFGSCSRLLRVRESRHTCSGSPTVPTSSPFSLSSSPPVAYAAHLCSSVCPGHTSVYSSSYSTSLSVSSCCSSSPSSQQQYPFAALSFRPFLRCWQRGAVHSVGSSRLSASPLAARSEERSLRRDKGESEIHQASLRFEQGFDETELGHDEYGSHSDSPASYVFRVKAAQASTAEAGREEESVLLKNPKIR